MVRDGNGALRYLDHGLMPLPSEVVEYHRSRIAERERKENTVAGVNWIIREATWASRSLAEEIAIVDNSDKASMRQSNAPASATRWSCWGRSGTTRISSAVRFSALRSRRPGSRSVFLGAVVPPEEFISAAKESAADAILVSSMYGMGRIDCADFGDKCKEAGLGHVKLYLGGILVTDPEQWPETEALFKGFRLRPGLSAANQSRNRDRRPEERPWPPALKKSLCR